jgi:septin family protein
MTYNEYIHAQMQNEIVWVCDYRFENDMVSKPARHIEPTKVMCDGNCNTTKKVLYSYYHFKRLNKKGEPVKSNIIAPYDGTGYRRYAGVSLQIFTTEKECRIYYMKQLRDLEDRLREELAQVVKNYNSLSEDLHSEKIQQFDDIDEIERRQK